MKTKIKIIQLKLPDELYSWLQASTAGSNTDADVCHVIRVILFTMFYAERRALKDSAGGDAH